MNQNDTIKDEIKKILIEINMLKYSIAAVESDMALSVQRIKQAQAAFSEPRQKRIDLLTVQLAKIVAQNWETLFPGHLPETGGLRLAKNLCHFEILCNDSKRHSKIEPFNAIPITIEPNV